MSQTYAEYLKANGATDDEIKILDVPAAQRAFAKQQSDLAAAQAAAAAAASKVNTYDEWYKVNAPIADQMRAERDIAKAEAAAEKARLKALQDAGLIEVDANANAAAAAAEAARLAGATTFDPAKHNLVTSDILRQVADKEGEAIATLADLSWEHSQLFPGKPVNWRELRKEAVASNQNVEQLWMTRYNVQAARDARSAADKAAHEKAIADAAVADYKSKNSQTNPMLHNAVPSSNPFTNRPPSAEDNLPWLKNDSAKVNDRVNRMLQNHPELVQ